MASLTWSMIKFPPVNLFNVPVLYRDCRHTHFMVLHSLKIKTCYDCGYTIATDCVAPEHQR